MVAKAAILLIKAKVKLIEMYDKRRSVALEFAEDVVIVAD